MVVLEEKHKASFLLGVVVVVIGYIAKVFYRDYIISHGIDDFGLAGSLPSFLYVIGFSQILQIRPIKYPALVMIVVTLGSVVYEFKQYYLSDNIDVNDIVASILGGVVSYLILLIIEKKFRDQEK